MSVISTPLNYEILQRDIEYDGNFEIAKYKIKHQFFSGKWSDVIQREVLEQEASAAVLPYDPVNDTVVLIEQFRPGILSHAKNPWITEIVAGLLDGEDAEHVARRESQEEAACELQALYPMYDYYVSPGCTNEYVYMFCGKVDSSNLGGIHGLKEENEDIRAFVIPADEAFALLDKGKIKAAVAIVALQWLQLKRSWLRDHWQKTPAEVTR